MSHSSARSAAATAASSSPAPAASASPICDKTVRVGGYGFPVSDEGSGAHLGVNALRHALRTLDGRAEPSAFSQEVLARFANDAAAVTEWMENASATDYAALAPHRRRATRAPAMRRRVRLMRKPAPRSATWSRRSPRRGAPRVALIGGLAEHVRPYLPAEVAASLVAPQADAMAGGILLAKQRRALEVNW